MKVIGTTATGFLVEATEAELANVCGAAYTFDAPWSPRKNPNGRGLEVGTQIQVSPRFQRLSAIESGEEKVRSGAVAMRALADLAESSMPSAIVPPPPAPEEPPAGGGL